MTSRDSDKFDLLLEILNLSSILQLCVTTYNGAGEHTIVLLSK